MMSEIGESLVAAWYQYVEHMDLVLEGTRLERQGELDVLAIDKTRVVGAEVATHIGHLDYGGYETTVSRISSKIQRAGRFLKHTFPAHSATVSFWSPVVPSGLYDRLQRIERVDLVVNGEYTRRIQELVDCARGTRAQTSSDAFRLLQILTHTRGPVRLRPEPHQPD